MDTRVVDSRIRAARPRTNVLVTFPDGRVFEAPPRTPVGDIVKAAEAVSAASLPPTAVESAPRAPVVAVLQDGRLRELTAPVTEDCSVVPVTTGEGDGVRIYRRSLSFLLMTAASEVFPGADVSIEHSASTVGGYFCEVRGHE